MAEKGAKRNVSSPIRALLRCHKAYFGSYLPLFRSFAIHQIYFRAGSQFRCVT